MQRLVTMISAFCLAQASVVTNHATAAELPISLKSGETAGVGLVYWVVNCRSVLKGDPVAEIMEGPTDVTVSIRKEKVTPRSNNCAKPVPGGTLVVAAPKEVKARSEGRLTVRLKYPTVDGERQASREYNVTLFP